MKKLYLIDTYAFFFRAYYAIPEMTNSKGLPTNAIYGLLSMTSKLLRDFAPEHIVFCLDHKKGSFRTELYEDYKANRGDMPEDLKPQVPYIEPLLKALGLGSLVREGFEADDIIGSLAIQADKVGVQSVIVSSDKDFVQIINNNIIMFDPIKSITYDVDQAVKKWGVLPEQMIDYLALVGDASDNVPGVYGIGPKGAQKLLSTYGSLLGIYENLSKIKGATLKKLEAAKDKAFLSQKLVTLRKDVFSQFSVADYMRKDTDEKMLKSLLQELEFKTLQKRLLEPTHKSEGKEILVSRSKMKKETGLTVKSADDLGNYLQPYSSLWIFDFQDQPYLSIDGNLVQADMSWSDLGTLLSKRHLKWNGFALKDLWHKLGMDSVLGKVETDLQMMMYLWSPNNVQDITVIQKAVYGEVWDIMGATEYYNFLRGTEKELLKRLKEQRLDGILEKIEYPLIEVLFEMERFGISINADILKDYEQELRKEVAIIQQQIFEASGEEFNISSPKKLGEVLFGKMQLKGGKKTKTGYSTKHNVLMALAKEHPIANWVIEFREIMKLLNTYVVVFPQLVSEKTKKIHTEFRQAVTTTGRLSSIKPNLQNIPIKTERGRRVRKAFVSDKGRVLLSVDYSQIELRILAHVSKDPSMIQAFREDRDIHAATASEIFQIPIDDVSPEQRRIAKTVNFGITYGQGIFGLAETLAVSRAESKAIIESYFAKFPGVRAYKDDTIQGAYENGYVETFLGRRRVLDELRSKSPIVRKFAERAAVNAPIQGAASDLMKMAMIQIRQSISADMLLQVHDEILFHCYEDDLEEESKEIVSIMENIFPLSVPLKVNVVYGKNWYEAHA